MALAAEPFPVLVPESIVLSRSRCAASWLALMLSSCASHARIARTDRAAPSEGARAALDASVRAAVEERDASRAVGWAFFAVDEFWFEAPETVTSFPVETLDTVMYLFEAEGISVATDNAPTPADGSSSREQVSFEDEPAEIETFEFGDGGAIVLHLPDRSRIESQRRGRRVYVISEGPATVSVRWRSPAQREDARRIITSIHRRDPAPAGARRPPSSDAELATRAMDDFDLSVDRGHPDLALAERSVSHFERALDRWPQHADTLRWCWGAARMYEALGRHRSVIDVARRARAIIDAHHARSLFSTNTALLVAEARALSAVGDSAAALASIRGTIATTAPNELRINPEAAALMGELLAGAGRFEEARAALRLIDFRIAASNPNVARWRALVDSVEASLRGRGSSRSRARP